ncbi:hypothetical protein FKG94_05200 [Exilibacterium tricleocarpae]|uniref:Uncharacterized protein n=1 Tax=Exilibacterium tricleocarpae TaxID=2591008 RepID=A0A545U3R9_9GAMM|nr:EscI/YscI/HrpB family type III secretion system inner rod protein [Exilibacterium tricleocarpae]TQV84064.1 hypothetical protein FKG94_05200 [Exilibacterium tricleocarpae]
MSSKISVYDQSIQTADAPAFQQELMPPREEDVRWFSEAINEVGNESNIGDRVVSHLQKSADDLKEKRESLDEQFKNASKGSSYFDIANTSRLASDYGFQTALMAKVISKSTQSIEKLTNLQ